MTKRANIDELVAHDGILKYREIFGPMHRKPAPLLVKLVEEGRSLA